MFEIHSTKLGAMIKCELFIEAFEKYGTSQYYKYLQDIIQILNLIKSLIHVKPINWTTT